MLHLNLTIRRGPLPIALNAEILNEYNRLTRSRIPIDEFVNWVQQSPAGAAWHGVLTTDEGRLVGHTSIFPFTARYGTRPITPAKSEYSFVHEDFRKVRVRRLRKFRASAFHDFGRRSSQSRTLRRMGSDFRLDLRKKTKHSLNAWA